MKNLSLPPRLALVIITALVTVTTAAQQPCQPPQISASAQGANIFTEDQENDLGDAVAEHLQRNYRVIDDEEVTGHLRKIGERIIKYLPPSHLHFQFYLFDANEVNAFTLPGGRIYVSRKMVAFALNEDELAGVIAHELGHIVARHSTIDMTMLFREVLGATQVMDHKDIFEKYNQLIENTARKAKAFEKLANHEEGEQNTADLIGLYAMVHAGCNPEAQTALWVRYNELKGKTSGFFADLFGRSKPGEKRLREMLKGLGTVPAECRGRQIAANDEEFKQWQTTVVSFSGLGARELLPGLITKKPLNPGLRSEINHLRFSPDGKFVLAQDDSGIEVLTRQPLASIFRINSLDAMPAHFTPDSKQVVFHTSNLRVEVWSVESHKRESAQELVVRKSCVQTALSPDGKTLACLDGDLGLSLFDVASSAVVFEKKNFTQIGYFDALTFLISALLAGDDPSAEPNEFVNFAFSPDGRYFVAGDRSTNFNAMGSIVSETQSLVLDLTSRTPVTLKGELKKIIGTGFAFVGNDKILGKSLDNPKKSGLYSFPAGELIETFDLISSSLSPVTSGRYVLLRNSGKLSGTLLDLTTRKMLMINQRPVLDAYDNILASEQRNSALGLFDIKGAPPVFVELSNNPLGRLYAADVSNDFHWLAVSGYSRGAVWDLSEGQMVFHLRGFRGAYVGGGDKTFYADFPKFEKTDRNIAHINLATKEAAAGSVLENDSARQYGEYIVQVNPAKKGGSYWENVTMEVLDAETLASKWSTPFPKERPRYWVSTPNHTIVLLWPVESKAAVAEIKAAPALTQQMAALKEKQGDYFLKVLNANTGEFLGQLLIETGKGSFRVRDVLANGDRVVVMDSQNRTLMYSLKTGQQVGRVFGTPGALSATAGLLCVETKDGVLDLYDLTSFEKRRELNFANPVSIIRFSEDGKRLFVLTSNQTAYVLDVANVTQASR